MQALKATLKQYGVFREANAALKASALTFQRARLAAHYERRARAMPRRYDATHVGPTVAARLASRGIQPREWPAQPGVLWVGADLNQDLGGFLPALRRHADVTCFHRSTGEYGVRLASADGRIRYYDPAVVADNDAQLVALVEARLRHGPPLHLLLGQMWAHTVSANTLRRIQAMGIATVNVSMDDRLPILWQRWHGHRLGSVGIAQGLDLVLTTSSECCQWYAVEDTPALWWPLASDPVVFTPGSEETKVHDVSFIGSRYGIRADIVEALESSGVRVSAYGPGWPNGSVPADQVAQIFAASRIILGIGTIAHNKRVYTLKLRDFDATMAGALYITHRNPDLAQLFVEGQDIECYTSNDELIRKVHWYLAHPEQRIAIAQHARTRACAEHTWDHRFTQLFSLLRGTHVTPLLQALSCE